MAFTQITITQDFNLADGGDPSGTVTFTPSAPMLNSDITVPAAPVAGRLDGTGALSITLDATTDPATTPTGVTYRVDEKINGVTRSYYVEIPHDQGSSLTLYNLAQAAIAPAISFPAGGIVGALSVKDYGATGDGAADDTAAISAAMDAANSAGQELYFPPGTYRCDAISKSYAPRISARPGTAVIQAINTSSWTWNFAGSLGSTVALSANATRNTSTLTVSSTTGLAAGDLILVADDQASYASQSTRKQGQIAQIASVDSGTALTLQESLYATKLTASSAFIAKVTAPDRAKVRGLRFLNTNAASTGGFLRFSYCRDIELDVEGEGSGAAGVRLEHCYDFRVRKIARNYYDNGTTQFGYGVEAVGACAGGQVEVHAVKVRHAFTCGGIDSTYGEPTSIRITGVAHGCSAQSWDAHAQGSDIVFADCLSFGARSYGFALRGRRQHVLGGIVQGGYGGVWLFESAFDNRVSGLRVTDVAASDSLDASGLGGRGLRIQSSAIGLTVTNCEFINVARDGIAIDSTGTDVSIMNNIFRNSGQSSGGGRSAIHLAGIVTRGRIVGNSIVDGQGSVTTQAAITLDATNVGLVLRNNDVQTGIPYLAGSGAASGITRTTAVDRLTAWLPSGAIQSTFPADRTSAFASAGPLSSGRLTLAGGVVLPAGQTVSTITFFSGGTPLASGTNQWFCLVDQSLNVLAKTADDTSTAWAGNAAKTLTISGGYTPATDIAVYVGINVTATTVPTLQCIGVPSLIGGITPMIAATSTTGLTNPASLGSTAGSLTALANLAYAYVS